MISKEEQEKAKKASLKIKDNENTKIVVDDEKMLKLVPQMIKTQESRIS